MESTKNLTVEDLRSDTSYDVRFVGVYNGTYTYDGLDRTFDELFYQQQLLQGRTKRKCGRCFQRMILVF